MNHPQRSINFNPAEQPFCRNSDPRTSADAAKLRNRRVRPVHYFVLSHHLQHKDSDRNAGIAAVEAGFAQDVEEGRRASRSVREDWEWTEIILKDDGTHDTIKNRGTNRSGKRNRLTEDGSAALMSQSIALR